MQTRRGSYALGVVLLLMAAPVAAQWAVHEQEQAGAAWKIARPGAVISTELIARNVAFIDACRPSTVEMMRARHEKRPAVGSHAVKIVSPSGKETVILCEVLNASYRTERAKGAE